MTQVAFSIVSMVLSKSFTILSFILLYSLPFIFNLYYSTSKRMLLQCNILLVCSWISFNGICYCLPYWRRFTFRNGAWKPYFHFLLCSRIALKTCISVFPLCSRYFLELHTSFFAYTTRVQINPFSIVFWNALCMSTIFWNVYLIAITNANL